MTAPAPRPDDWKVGRRGGGCASCGAPFAPRGEAVSAIYEEAGAFARRDFCAACFQHAERRGSPFSWWSAPVPEPAPKKAAFDLGVAKEFLQRLLRDPDPSRDSLRYLLVLLLLRKRCVVLVGQEAAPDGGEVMTIRVPPNDDEIHQVRCVELDADETEKLREELGRLFQI